MSRSDGARSDSDELVTHGLATTLTALMDHARGSELTQSDLDARSLPIRIRDAGARLPLGIRLLLYCRNGLLCGGSQHGVHRRDVAMFRRTCDGCREGEQHGDRGKPEDDNGEKHLNEGVAAISPSTRLFMTQQSLEPLIRDRAEELGAAMRYATELVSFEQDADGVTGLIRNVISGETDTVRAKYMIGADGNRSPILVQYTKGGENFETKVLGRVGFDKDFGLPK